VFLLAVGVGLLSNAWISGEGLPYAPSLLARWLPRAEILEVEETSPNAEVPQARISNVSLAKLVEKPQPQVDISPLTMDRTSAMRVLLRRWGVELGNVGDKDPCERLVTFGLSCEPDQGGWGDVRAFDRPALLRIDGPDGDLGYAALGELDEELATLDVEEGSRRVPLESLDGVWNGEYLIVWQPPLVGDGVIGPSSSRESVRWLRKLLSEVPGLGVQDNGSSSFDQGLVVALRRFQEQQGLDIDGVAGPRTLIRLHNAVAMPGVPRLVPAP
jgi:general secretion pathway protein A